MITLQQIQRKIAEAIRQSGKTQTEIANLINVKQQTVSHYVKGDISPSLETLANLCIVLDLDANDILCVR